MQKLRNNCDTVLNSEPVKIIIRNEGIKASHWRSLCTTGVIEDVYKDKNDMIEQTRILSSSATLPLPTQSSIVSKRDSDEFNDNTSNGSSNKKLNHLKLGDIKGLSLNDKLEKLTKAYGEGNILDLVSPGLIPSRFAKEMKNIVCGLKIPLKLVCAKEERVILIKTSEATSLKQIETVIKSIMLVPRVGLKSYLFISLSKITECHATTIKYLRKTKKIDQNEKNVKIDLILFNNQLGDIFSCEDKPTNATEADVRSDIKKAKEFCEKRLLYIQSLLPYPSNIKHIEVISSQFHGLKLTVYGSKMTEEETIIHYQKTKALIPTAPAHMSQAAHFLLTVMSLQRAIVINLKKLEAIYEVALHDSVNFLVSSFEGVADNLFLRDDSSLSSTGDDKSTTSTSRASTLNEINWMQMEQSRRVVKLIDDKINGMVFKDDILTCEDWEDILCFNETST
ncbi:hypothetical protein G6F62_008661 [Rhizopus arrhizus]|nr:hypothetical protein G6F24_010170 [Rhizopus arrhizus]KAG0802568.1 hypothetical protein G6F22_000128 [Rhizopus arrhizus]KAG0836994.1 hypothetical protein G6F18_005099 [Rhizopus arrhizus]KAG0837499.1 hypothetical protein G6F19_003659 [Rhizopus arrhizus]KAG0857679.1 hypothetical protein G6F17_003478 [Rhizopus arrhizus]